MNKFVNAVGNLYACRELYNWGGSLVPVYDTMFIATIKQLLHNIGFDHEFDDHSLLDEDYIKNVILGVITADNKKVVKGYIYEASVSLQHMLLMVLTPISHTIQFLSPKFMVKAINKVIRESSVKLDVSSVFVTKIVDDTFIKGFTDFTIESIQISCGVKVLIKRDNGFSICFLLITVDNQDPHLGQGVTFVFKAEEDNTIKYIETGFIN